MNWISVEDQLPETRYMPVLCFNSNAPVYNQCVYQAEWFLDTKKFRKRIPETLHGTVTHWMPLPEPPKEEK